MKNPINQEIGIEANYLDIRMYTAKEAGKRCESGTSEEWN